MLRALLSKMETLMEADGAVGLEGSVRSEKTSSSRSGEVGLAAVLRRLDGLEKKIEDHPQRRLGPSSVESRPVQAASMESEVQAGSVESVAEQSKRQHRRKRSTGSNGNSTDVSLRT